MTDNESPVPGSETPVTSQQSPVTDQEEEIDLLDLAIVLAKHKWLVLGMPFVAAMFAVVYALLLPNIYIATTKILPPQQSQSSAAALLAQLGGLAGAAGAKSPNDLYIAMLRSRTVVDNLAQRFDLQKVYDARTPQGIRSEIEGRTNISSSSKDGIIAIGYADKDPKLAATIANAYVEELHRVTQTLAVTEASQRRLFFERQLVQAKGNLGKAEVAARQALEEGGLVKVDDQGRAMVETTARLRAQMAVKEVQIGAMRTFAAERNPDLRLAQRELEALKREAAKIEGASGVKAAKSASGTKGVDNLSLLRDMKYYETIYELLAKQYELARIDEARDAPLIQVLEKAIEPEQKSKPSRRLIVLLAALAAGFVAVLWAFGKEALDRVRGNPEQSRRLHLFRSYLTGK